MDRDEALNLLHGGSKGIAEWNRRRHTRHKIPDLSFATLLSANLRGANLRNVDLTNAGLNFVDLTNAGITLSTSRRPQSAPKLAAPAGTPRRGPRRCRPGQRHPRRRYARQRQPRCRQVPRRHIMRRRPPRRHLRLDNFRKCGSIPSNRPRLSRPPRSEHTRNRHDFSLKGEDPRSLPPRLRRARCFDRIPAVTDPLEEPDSVLLVLHQP